MSSSKSINDTGAATIVRISYNVGVSMRANYSSNISPVYLRASVYSVPKATYLNKAFTLFICNLRTVSRSLNPIARDDTVGGGAVGFSGSTGGGAIASHTLDVELSKSESA